jgi:hypothetical protein
MPSDFAGNTLNTSRSISLASTSNFSDWVGSSDTNDFYRFNVTSRGTVGLTLSGLSNDADLRLIQDRNNNGAIEAGEILASSSLGGTQVDRISQMVEAGTYFVAVDRYSGDTFYNLQTQFQPFDGAGDTLSGARGISVGPTAVSFTDQIGGADPNDYYRFTLNNTSDFRLSMTGMTADADVQLLNGSGALISSSAAGGASNESISSQLAAGTYYVRVYPYGGANTNYSLSLSAAPTDGAGDTMAAARLIGLGPTAVSFTDQIGGADPNDYYRFTLSNTSDFRLSMTGLTADADVQLLNASGASIAYSAAGGSMSESISSQLTAGTYYVRVYPYNGANTNYSLSLSATTIPTTDWFSQNLRDASLVNMARTFAADGSLSRNDMLNLFRDSEDGGVVDGNETADLRTLVANAGRFQMSDSVRWLSNQVVTGAGSSIGASAFESNLVGRWFLGNTAPTAVFNGQALSYTNAQESLFGSSGQARIGDIDQGSFGDCAFLAALGATFAPQSDDYGNRSSSVVNSMITDNGDNTYTMRFYNPLGNGQAEAQYVTVDRRIATVNGQSPFGAQTNGSIWTALAERAYAQWREWRGNGTSGYNLIGNGDTIDNPLQYVTGRTATATYGNYSFTQISSGLQSGRALTAGRFEESSTSTIVGRHAYSITNAYTDGSGQQRVVVRNPWGVDGRTTVGSNDGFIDLTFSEFQRSFGGIAVA